KLLTGGRGEDPVEPVAHTDDLARLDLNVGRISARAASRLVQQEAGVGQAEPLLDRHGHVDERPGAGYPSRSDNPNPGSHEADHVVDRVSRFNVPTLGVEEERYGVVRLGRHRQQLRSDPFGQLLVDLAADYHGAGTEQ